MNNFTWRAALFLYTLIFLLLSFPYWGNREVVAPHRQFLEVARIDITGSTQQENRKFSDFTNGYIPELFYHLKGYRSGWIKLWTHDNELGRPIYQISGFSPAYFPSWLIANLTADPWRFITTLSLLTCFFAGVFLILFCREIALAPLAGLIAGTSLATSPLFMYWLTFPMFPAVWCWSACALWAVTRLARKPDLLGWGALAFSGYSLLMTAYPQPVVFQAYLLGGYSLYLAGRKQRFASISMTRFLALIASALVVGAVMALPVYLDLVFLFAESARVVPAPSFFTLVLPKFASVTEFVRFFVLGTVPELFGNPVAPNFPFSYDGLSVTPLVVFFAVIGLLVAHKQTWGWWLAIVVLCLFAFVHPLYVFGVKYLGLNLSRSTPLGSIMLPLTVIVAYGADALIRDLDPPKRSQVVALATACILVIMAIGLGYGLAIAMPIRWGTVLLMFLLVGMLAAQIRKTRSWLMVSALVLVLAAISYPLMLRQDPAQIATTSPLVEKVRANLPLGSRFAVASPGISALPPNLNAGLGLPSVHSYNSLSSRRYHTLIKALGGEVQTYGRWNGAISPDYSSAMFWMSNISLMLSPTRLIHENLAYLGEESGIHLHRVVSRMGDSLQVSIDPTSMRTDGLHIADPSALPSRSPMKVLDEGDALEFDVTPMASTALILSQKFHRDWQATALSPLGWAPAKTIEVNGVFQGVFLPPDASRVRLEFKPFARYAWLAHVFWLLLLAMLGFMAWQRRSNTGIYGVSGQ